MNFRVPSHLLITEKAEIALNRYFDKVPKDAWRYER
jgi:hypothetical protein